MDFWSLRFATTVLALVLAVGFLALYLLVIWKIAKNKIDISTVIMETDGTGKASISRFQLLIFTFTISGLYAVLSIEAGTLIEVPNGALTLLGLSGGSFLVSKGIGGSPQRIDTSIDNGK